MVRKLTILIILAFMSSACVHAYPGANRLATGTITTIPTSPIVPTGTPIPPPQPTSVPPSLPLSFQTSLLNPLDLPHTYIQQPCQYLLDKWSTGNSAPGTVVMIIMFHSITDGTITDPNQISEFNFRRLMSALHQDGFQAITTGQLAAFMENNSKIPNRSVLLVTDDKHTANYFNVLFHQYWINYGWPVVNAWISDDLTTADLWKQQENLNAAGWVDYQAHGVVSLPITPNSPDQYVRSELIGPIEVFLKHFNKRPIAFIWPGGGFSPRAVDMARQAGYRLGFTVNPRGPLMFNWVPLADGSDPDRPTWIPEGPVGDPLMVLPRYWDTDAILHLDEVIQIGQAAGSYARENRLAELQYYDTVCSAVYGTLR
jgi:hypothetical protein